MSIAAGGSGLDPWEQAVSPTTASTLKEIQLRAPAQAKDYLTETGERLHLALLKNRDLLRRGLIPCETNPETGGLSRTGDPAHALAVFTISGRGFESRHVCRECAMEFYSKRPIKEGIYWG